MANQFSGKAQYKAALKDFEQVHLNNYPLSKVFKTLNFPPQTNLFIERDLSRSSVQLETNEMSLPGLNINSNENSTATLKYVHGSFSVRVSLFIYNRERDTIIFGEDLKNDTFDPVYVVTNVFNAMYIRSLGRKCICVPEESVMVTIDGLKKINEDVTLIGLYSGDDESYLTRKEVDTLKSICDIVFNIAPFGTPLDSALKNNSTYDKDRANYKSELLITHIFPEYDNEFVKERLKSIDEVGLELMAFTLSDAW